MKILIFCLALILALLVGMQPARAQNLPCSHCMYPNFCANRGDESWVCINNSFGAGKNGSPCFEGSQVCQFPYYCYDRGDFVLACVGGPHGTGKKGDLCVNQPYFCKSPLSCQRSENGIYQCT